MATAAREEMPSPRSRRSVWRRSVWGLIDIPDVPPGDSTGVAEYAQGFRGLVAVAEGDTAAGRSSLDRALDGVRQGDGFARGRAADLRFAEMAVRAIWSQARSLEQMPVCGGAS